MENNFKILSLIVLLIQTGCGGGVSSAAINASEANLSSKQTVDIYKSDGAIQCEHDGIAAEDMKAELVKGGVDVVCAQKADSGLAVIAMCGAPSTAINIFSIRVSDWSRAEVLGFKRLQELTDYSGQGCGK